MNFYITFKILTRIMVICSIAFLSCMGVALIYHESVLPFVYATLVATGLGTLFFLLSRDKPTDAPNKRDAYFSVTIAWLTISVLGMMPFVFSGYFHSVTDAFFESVSGFTTTGSSILSDIEALPKSILFWRSMTHWIGGIGIIFLVIIIMPSLKMGSYNLFILESSLPEKISPRIRSVGYRLLYIYLGLTGAEVIFLLLGGMDLFDSVCHAFGTIATGGFSPKNTSIADYSPYIQYVIMIFMLLAGTNFILLYFLFKGRITKIIKNEELIFYLGLIATAGFIIMGILHLQTDKPLELSFRESFFQVISIVTCTGFATSDYLLWPQMGWLLIFMLMFSGGCTGSTAGGIKIARHVIGIKIIKNTFRTLFHANVVNIIRLNSKPISKRENNQIITFMLWYVMVFIAGSLILIAIGLDGETATSAIATAMAGIGPGIGTVGPAANFGHLPDLAKIVISVFMILGRLEIYTVIMLFTISFWRD